MNYLKHYMLLMEKSKIQNRKKGIGNYYELHHIVPRSEGGSDNVDNLVLLTGREHFMAHYLLYKADPTIESRARSFWFMCQDIKRRRNIISARAYELARQAVSVVNRTGKVIECEVCGTKLYRQKHAIRSRIFCSRECFGNSAKPPKEKLGWTEESRKNYKDKRAGKININNGTVTKIIWKRELEWYLEAGWKRGRGPYNKPNKKWYNNGEDSKYFVEGTQPEGWNKGRIVKRTLGRKAISKDGVVKFVTDPDKWIAEGWELGNSKYYPGYKHRKKST